MEGIFYSQQEVRGIFGWDAADVYLYRGVSYEDGGPVLYLRLLPGSLQWFCILRKPAQGERQTECLSEVAANPIPLFQLSLSHKLAVRNDLDSMVAGQGFRSLPATLLCELGDPVIFGYREVAFSNLHNSSLTFGALFLDFLFDLRHSRVFERCEFICSFESRLMEHPLVNAIHDKCEYYWWRKQYETAKRDIAKDAGSVPAGYLSVCAEKFLNAEGEWIDRCMSEKSEDVFHEGGSWFSDDIGDELRKILFAWCDQPLQEFEDIGRTKQTWLSVCRFREDVEQDGGEEKKGRVYRERYRAAASWLLKRYDVNAALDVFGLYISNIRTGFPKAFIYTWVWVAVCMFAAVLPTETFGWLCLLFTTSYGLVKFIYRSNCKLNLDARRNAASNRGGKRSIQCLDYTPFHPADRLLYLGLVPLIFLYSAEVLGRFYEVTHIQYCALVGLLMAPFVFFSSMVLIHLERSKRGNRRCAVAIDFVRLFFPRLVFAIIGAWIFSVITEEVWSTSLLKSPLEALGFGCLMLVFSIVYVMAKIGRVLSDHARNARRATRVVATAFILSMYFGTWAMSMFGPSMIEFSEILEVDAFEKEILHIAPELSGELGGLHNLEAGGNVSNSSSVLEEIDWDHSKSPLATKLAYISSDRWAIQAIFPWSLLYRACFCVFIALFLQLVFEEKEITEPL